MVEDAKVSSSDDVRVAQLSQEVREGDLGVREAQLVAGVQGGRRMGGGADRGVP